jgi:uncharacterized protein YbjT (DUF2867 family)
VTVSQVHRRVLVIGASGFLGRQVARALLADGRSVRCMARDATSVQDLTDAGCEVVEGDVLKPASVDRALQSVDAAYICIHTLSPQAASASGQDFMDVEQAGMRNIVAACKTHDVHRLVYVTSIGVAPDAPSSWLRGRWQTEQSLFDSGLDVSVIRPGMIVGRGGQGFNAVLRGAKNRVAIGLGSAKQRMRTIAVDDLAYYLVAVLDEPRSYGNHYDVGNDDVLTIDEMIDIAAECLGRPRPAKIHVPARLLSVCAPLIERVSKLPRGSLKGLADSLQVDMSGDPTPIRTMLTRAPKSYRQAVERVVS